LKVKRIVSDIGAADVALAKTFYGAVFGLDLLMDFGWINIYGSSELMSVQLSVPSEGGSGTAVPNLSIEVDDLEMALAKTTAAGFPVEYGPVDEPGVYADSMCAIHSASSSTFCNISDGG
jgi:predicted enzyme related to lactoylglutathione lyase